MRRSVANCVLGIGFFAVAAAVLVARDSPPTGYEASIYAGTPTATWLGLGVAMAVAVAIALLARGLDQAGGIGLGGLAVTAIVALPAVRNYRFSGMGDALTHLGWTRDFLEGAMYPHELFYPGVHGIASALHLTGGIPVERALLLVVVALFVPFVVFVPLVVRDVTGDGAAVGFAAIAAWLVLPINNVATHMGVHTNSNALFLVPVVFFAFVAYSRRRADLEALPLGLSPFGLLLLASSVALLLVHPQQMVNVVVVLAAVSLVQFVSRRRSGNPAIAGHRTAYAHTLALGGLFVAWSLSNERFRDAVGGLVYGVVTADVGAGSEVGQRGSSLSEVGGSLGELFVKMFLVSAVVAGAVGLFLFLAWLGRTRIDAESRAFVTYFGVALVPLGAIFLVYFVGTPTMAFRQVGFIFVVITVLAGVALARGTGWLSGLVTTPGATAVAAAALGACLVLALATLFATPFIYTPTQHVTDAQVGGYESAFEHGSEEIAYAGYGFGVTRYGQGIYGVERDHDRRYRATIPGTVEPDPFEAGAYGEAYPPDRYYLVVTEYDRVREHEVYRELHHTEEGLADLGADPAANELLSNGEVTLYAVEDR